MKNMESMREKCESTLLKNLSARAPKEEEMSTLEKNEDIARLPRVSVDFRIPLPWLIGGAGVVLWGLISMYFTLQRVSESVTELQITVKANNAQTIQYASEQTLIKFRLEKLEQLENVQKGSTK